MPEIQNNGKDRKYQKRVFHQEQNAIDLTFEDRNQVPDYGEIRVEL